MTSVYHVTGELFFAFSNDPYSQLEYDEYPTSSSTSRGSHIWDASSVAALDSISTKYARMG